MRRLFPALLAGLSLGCAQAAELKACAELDDFPPFDYQTADPARQLPGAATGSTVELLMLIGERLGVKISLRRYPWARCMLAVEKGLMDIGLDAYHDPARARRFDFSLPYYRLTPQLFYYRSRFPQGMPANTPAQLKAYLGCGIHGYTYRHYHLDLTDFDLRAETHTQLVDKLRAGRCDYFIEELEVMRGFALTGRDFLADPMLATAPVPQADTPQLHLILSRKSRMAQQLKAPINATIDALNRSGETARMVERHLQR